MNQIRIEAIEHILVETFQPTALEIIDDSHHHVGHVGAQKGGGHFTVKICSSKFEGIPLVKRHQMIYRALSNMMEKDIHALSIRATTQEEGV